MFTIVSQLPFLKKQKKKENILSNYTVKKVYFSYNKIQQQRKQQQYMKKSLTVLFYVAYVQESPETANPSISSLRVLCLLSIGCKSSLHTHRQSSSISISHFRGESCNTFAKKVLPQICAREQHCARRSFWS